jgi:flavin reductase (DIM6/NTAB) family NADH-FMN oxidoreductase RutF
MPKFKEIELTDWKENPFTLIGQDWMLITAEHGGKLNTMTAAWGGLGVMWGKNVAFVVIRPTRYTWEFVEGAQGFSLTFFDHHYKEQLSYLGSVSGRKENKIANAGLTTIFDEGLPYFQETSLALFCRKLYRQDYHPHGFIDSHIDEKWYPEKDYHTMYIAEIYKALVSERS